MPQRATRKVHYGGFCWPVAVNRGLTRAQFAVVTFADLPGASRPTTRLSSATLVNLDLVALGGETLAALSQAVASLLRRGEAVDIVKQRLDRGLEAMLAAQRGRHGVELITDDHLQSLLGSPALAAGRVAMTSDGVTDLAAGAGSVAAAIATSSGWMGVTRAGSIPVGAIFGGGTATVLAGVAAQGTAAFVGGYAIGTAADRGLGLLAGYLTDGEYNSLGSWMYGQGDPEEEAARMRETLGLEAEDALDAGTGAGTGSDDAGSGDDSSAGTESAGPESGGEEDGGTGAGTSDEDDSEDDDSENDTDAESDSSDESAADDAGNDEDTPGTEGAGTTLPPGFDYSGSGLGILTLYAATRLGGQAARQQLRALEIVAGGALGVDRDRDSFSVWAHVDEMLGGVYLRHVERGLQARGGRYGLRDRETSSGELDATRLANYGLTYPSPLDALFRGRTVRTRLRS